MAYYLDFSGQAQKDISFHKTSGNKAILKKLLVLFEELIEHPFEGTGKPELLKLTFLDIGLEELTVNIES